MSPLERSRPPGPPVMAALSLTFVLAFAVSACIPAGGGTPSPAAGPLSKIAFSLDDINADGLVGAAGAQRALDYEFCIPADENSLREVRAIALAVRVMPGSRGRIGCSAAETLCINSTHSPGWRDTLLRLAALPYVRRIQRTDWE